MAPIGRGRARGRALCTLTLDRFWWGRRAAVLIHPLHFMGLKVRERKKLA